MSCGLRPFAPPLQSWRVRRGTRDLGPGAHTSPAAAGVDRTGRSAGHVTLVWPLLMKLGMKRKTCRRKGHVRLLVRMMTSRLVTEKFEYIE